MNESSYLNPANMKAQCDAAITKLKNDSEATYALEEKLSVFQEDAQIKSEAFDALKLQMEDYKTVLQTMRTANDCDIHDFRFLKIAVGFQELNGGVILAKKQMQMSAKQFNEQKAAIYREKARKATSATTRFNYNTKVVHYEGMAELEQKLYDVWQEKENQYDGIESLTSGLFAEGTAIRATVESALDNITSSFYDGAYHPDMNAGWRSEIYDIYFNRVFHISESGELTIDMEEVEKILRKDAGEITSAEYDVLALAYLMADDEDLAVFMQGMMGERVDYNTSWYASTMNYKVYSEWRIDKEKLNEIRARMKAYAEAELKVIQEYGTAGDEEAVLESEIERDVMLQRMTLLDVISQIGDFSGEYEVDYPTISVKKSEGGEIILGLCEGLVVNGSKPTGSTLRNSTVIVSKTVNGEDIGLVQSNYAGYALSNYFGGYAFGNDMGKFAVNKAKGKVKIDNQVFKNWSDRIKAIPGKEKLGKAIGYLPVIGEGVKAVVNTFENKKDAERKVEFIAEEIEDINVALLYSGFDCCVSFVDFDLANNNNHEFYPYEGESTDSKIADFNKEDVLKEALSTELTREMVLENPEDIVEFWQKVQSDDNVGKKFRKILSK